MLGHIIVSLLGTSCLPSQPPLPPGSRNLSPLQGWAGDLDLGKVGSGGGLWPSWARLGASPEPGEGAPGFPEPGRAAIYSAGNLAGLFQASQVPKESRLQAERGAPRPSSHSLSNEVSSIFPMLPGPHPGPAWHEVPHSPLQPLAVVPIISLYGRAER